MGLQVLAGIFALYVAGQAVAAPRAAIAFAPNPGDTPPLHEAAFKTVVTVNGQPIDVIAHSQEDVEDVTEKIQEICRGPQKQFYPELCAPSDDYEDGAGKGLDHARKKLSSQTKDRPAKTTRQPQGETKNGSPKTVDVRPTIKKPENEKSFLTPAPKKPATQRPMTQQSALSTSTKKVPQTTSTKPATLPPKTQLAPSSTSKQPAPAQPTPTRKTPQSSSGKYAPLSSSNKPEKTQSTSKAPPESTSHKLAEPGPNKMPPQQSFKKLSSSSSKKPAGPTADKKTPLQSFKTYALAPSTSSASQSRSSKPAEQLASNKPGLSAASSNISTFAPSANKKPVVQPTNSSIGRKALATALISSKKGSPSSSPGAPPSPTGRSTSSQKPLTKTSSAVRSPTKPAPRKPKYSPFWNSTVSSAQPAATAPKKQVLMTGTASQPTTLKTIKIPAKQSSAGEILGMIVEEKWVEEAVDGKTTGHWIASTLRSYSAPTPLSQAEDTDITIPDVRDRVPEVPYDDEIETLLAEGWELTKRGESFGDDDEIETSQSQDRAAAKHDVVGKIASEAETSAEAGNKLMGEAEVPEPTPCVVKVPVFNGLLGPHKMAKAFKATTTATKSYDCGKCGATGTIIPVYINGKGPAVQPAATTVTAIGAFTEVVRVCATPSA